MNKIEKRLQLQADEAADASALALHPGRKDARQIAAAEGKGLWIECGALMMSYLFSLTATGQKAVAVYLSGRPIEC